MPILIIASRGRMNQTDIALEIFFQNSTDQCAKTWRVVDVSGAEDAVVWGAKAFI